MFKTKGAYTFFNDSHKVNACLKFILILQSGVYSRAGHLERFKQASDRRALHWKTNLEKYTQIPLKAGWSIAAYIKLGQS